MTIPTAEFLSCCTFILAIVTDIYTNNGIDNVITITQKNSVIFFIKKIKSRLLVYRD